MLQNLGAVLQHICLGSKRQTVDNDMDKKRACQYHVYHDAVPVQSLHDL